MAERYQAYPEYKDSGVEWLGDVPAKWKISRIKFFCEINPPKSNLKPMHPDTIVSFIPMEAIGQYGQLDTSRKKCLKHVQRGYTYVGEGDVCIAKITPCFENGKGAVFTGLKNGMAFATTEIIPHRCKKSEDSPYLYYLLTSQPFNKIAEGSMYGAGGQKRVSEHFVANYHFSIPPVSERLQIAAFLDHETAKIDTLIQKQQKLIALLKEKRQAVISHAVTKGLNPDAPMKDSGVEWLGEVPAHWVVTRLKYECKNIVDCLHSTPDYQMDGEYPAIRTADVYPGFLNVEEARTVFEDVYKERTSRLVPEENDIIYSREGERFGFAALIPKDSKVCLGQRVMLFRSNNSPEFLMWSLNAGNTYRQAQQDVIGATSPHVNVETIKNFYLPWPPESERVIIAKYVNQSLLYINNVLVKGEAKIKLLQERRTALISAAVTGKIDVRNWQPPPTHRETQ